MMIQQIREQLKEAIDENYREFHQNLVPGMKTPFLGIRIPKLRETAKDVAKENGKEYIRELYEWEKNHEIYYEERMLQGMIIGYLKCEIKEREALLDEFVPKIDNWAICDSCCTSYKFMKADEQYWFSYLQKYLNSNKEFEIRFSVVALLDYFITEKYIDQILDLICQVECQEYYVQMAVAWAISVCYVKFPKQTLKILTDNKIEDDFTHNKSIQKIRESYRVSQEEKERLNMLRRSNKV